MSETVVSVLAAFSVFVLALAFRKLPGERWQVLATIPFRKHGPNSWTGVNLTWYGFLSAGAFAFAAGILVFLTGSVGIGHAELLFATVPVALLGLPAAKLVARHVEGKSETLTIGGAVFVASLAAPPILLAVHRLSLVFGGPGVSVLSLLAALCIAVAFGEGFGRMACISFGCCYGKPLAGLSPRVRALFERLAFTFRGETKKICYASGLAGVKVVPVQAMTAAINVGIGLLGTYLFLEGHHKAAILAVLVSTQGWRIFSETLRADDRGGGRISTYQKMALVTFVFLGAFALGLPAESPGVVDVSGGLASLTSSGSALGIELIFAVVFFFTGWSRVTGSTVSFHVHRHKV